PIILLAIPGTLITFIVVGLSSNLILGLSAQVAFTFAALMSATDPISVLSIFKSMNVSKKLSIAVEGESLLNDGVAVVLFNIAVFKFLTYANEGIGGSLYAIFDFLYICSGGVIVGLIFGIVFSFICKLFDDSPLEIAFSVIMFYGVFIIAEHFHFSGIISVVISGIVLGNYGTEIGMSPTTHVNINSFWETMAFFANSIVFFMVGIEITTTNFQDKWILIILSIILVLIGRSIAVYLSTISLKNFPLKYKHIINWGGIKGSLSIALALSIPMNFQGRDEILILTFSVVLFSLIIQGLTIKPLIKFLKVNELKRNHKKYETILLDYFKIKYALASLNKSKEEGLLIEHDVEEEMQEYKQNFIQISSKLKDMENKYPELKNERIDKAKIKVLYSQHKAITDMSLL
ncbi:cation:proton antiporter, partial [Parabacteroides distasonis]|uniref:cation:proton antiporter n=1 Tax=Parabacteroides distasonis TaxID=823 RepID=UPI0012B1782C|nr:sodium:proton antiporter [Parabacteroides distasonis]